MRIEYRIQNTGDRRQNVEGGDQEIRVSYSGYQDVR